MNDIVVLNQCINSIYSLIVSEDVGGQQNEIDYFNHWMELDGNNYRGRLNTYIVAKLLGFIKAELTIPNTRRKKYELDEDVVDKSRG